MKSWITRKFWIGEVPRAQEPIFRVPVRWSAMWIWIGLIGVATPGTRAEVTWGSEPARPGPVSSETQKTEDMQAAGWVSPSQPFTSPSPQKPVEILPARPVLPDGKIQILSKKLRIPLAHGTVSRGQEEPGTWTCDARGLMDRIPWSGALRLHIGKAPLPLADASIDPLAKPSSTSPGMLPKTEPEGRWLLGELGTARIHSNHSVLPSVSRATACVETTDGQIYPVAVESLTGLEGKGSDTEWVLRFREPQWSLETAPFQRLCVRVESNATGATDEALLVQVWNLAELRRGSIKPLIHLPTGTLEIQAHKGADFGPFVANSHLQALTLLQETRLGDKAKETLSPPLAAWIAAPTPGHWKWKSPQEARLAFAPTGRGTVIGYFSGSPTATAAADVRAGETTRVELFDPNAPSEREELSPEDLQEGEVNGSTSYVSIVWDATGALFSGGALGPNQQDPLPLDSGVAAMTSVRLPTQGPYLWGLYRVSSDGSLWRKDVEQGSTPSERWTSPWALQAARSATPAKSILLIDREQALFQNPGTIHLYLMGSTRSQGATVVHQESFTLHWPEDAGAIIETESDLSGYSHWYAVSMTGAGSHGLLHALPTGEASGEPILDPTMESGWSALVVRRFDTPSFDRAASMEFRRTGPGAVLEAQWNAAGGTVVASDSFPFANAKASQFGVSLLSARGIPGLLRVETPGVQQILARPPEDSNVIDIRLRPRL